MINMEFPKSNFENNDKIKNKKKYFNKKKWREQKYDNKAKILKWENIQRKRALREYSKELKKCSINLDIKGNNVDNKQKFDSSFKKAQYHYQKIQEEKEQKRKEKELENQRRKEALKAYKEKKAIRHKKLFHKTRLGKPSMKGRLELLLEKIQKEYEKNEE